MIVMVLSILENHHAANRTEQALFGNVFQLKAVASLLCNEDDGGKEASSVPGRQRKKAAAG
jgi:hypothetical protein